MAATGRLLGRRRLEEITVSEIIAEAGVSRASFYIRFESKYAVVGALATAATAEVYEALWKPFLDGEEPLTEAVLVDHWHATLERWGERRAVLVAAAASWRADPRAIDEWRELWAAYASDLRAFIERARARDHASDGIDAATLAVLLTWMHENVLYLAFTGTAPEFADHDQLARAQAGVWLRLIC